MLTEGEGVAPEVNLKTVSTQVTKMQVKVPPCLGNRGNADVTGNPKQGTSGPTKRT